MTGAKVCLTVAHRVQHGNADICPLCGGEILRFKGEDPGLDDLFDALPDEPSTPIETLVVRTRAGFDLWLEDAGTDAQGRRLWRQTRATLGTKNG